MVRIIGSYSRDGRKMVNYYKPRSNPNQKELFEVHHYSDYPLLEVKDAADQSSWSKWN